MVLPAWKKGIYQRIKIYFFKSQVTLHLNKIITELSQKNPFNKIITKLLGSVKHLNECFSTNKTTNKFYKSTSIPYYNSIPYAFNAANNI